MLRLKEALRWCCIEYFRQTKDPPSIFKGMTHRCSLFSNRVSKNLKDIISQKSHKQSKAEKSLFGDKLLSNGVEYKLEHKKSTKF